MPDSPRTVVELWTECSQRIRDLRTLRLMLVEEEAKGCESNDAIRETDELLAEALRRERELLAKMTGRPASKNGTS